MSREEFKHKCNAWVGLLEIIDSFIFFCSFIEVKENAQLPQALPLYTCEQWDTERKRRIDDFNVRQAAAVKRQA